MVWLQFKQFLDEIRVVIPSEKVTINPSSGSKVDDQNSCGILHRDTVTRTFDFCLFNIAQGHPTSKPVKAIESTGEGEDWGAPSSLLLLSVEFVRWNFV